MAMCTKGARGPSVHVTAKYVIVKATLMMKPQLKRLKVRADKGSISDWCSRFPQFISLAMIGIWNLPGGVGIFRDQAEELPLHWTQL